jgi:hypothetical protein
MFAVNQFSQLNYYHEENLTPFNGSVMFCCL